MDAETTKQQETTKKPWNTPKLTIHGDVTEVTAEMMGGRKTSQAS